MSRKRVSTVRTKPMLMHGGFSSEFDNSDLNARFNDYIKAYTTPRLVGNGRSQPRSRKAHLTPAQKQKVKGMLLTTMLATALRKRNRR